MNFLVWKDTTGSEKTQIHDLECENLEGDGSFVYNCQCWYVKNILVRFLKMVFKVAGQGDAWDSLGSSGNPACAQEVKEFLAAVKDEVSVSCCSKTGYPYICTKK